MKKLNELTKYIQKEIPSLATKTKYCLCCNIAGEDFCKRDKCEHFECHCPDFLDDDPIILEDVLMVIGKTSKLIYIDCDGYFNEMKAKWIMNKPLHLQTPETISFLYDLIIKK